MLFSFNLKIGIYIMIIEKKEFRQFADYIKSKYGINFKDEKKTLIEGRLGQLLASLNINSLTEYMEYVKADKSGKAASLMLDKITTNYTFFMRESEHFKYFKEFVLPYLSKTVKDKDLRIWSAACSTGEEPYTLAMIMDEYFGPNKGLWNTEVLATDISQKALNIAKKGIYDKDKTTNLPKAWKSKYFKAYNDQQHILIEKIRKEVVFANINLMNISFPFKRKMHVIFCRNAMIYFDNEAKEKLVQHFYDITEPGGYLFIGHSEGLNRETMRYRYVMPAVYRKE